MRIIANAAGYALELDGTLDAEDKFMSVLMRVVQETIAICRPSLICKMRQRMSNLLVVSEKFTNAVSALVPLCSLPKWVPKLLY